VSLEERGDGRATREKDPGATECALRRGVRRSDNCASFGTAPPELPTFKALLSLWPTWLSYAVSYLFIAIVWANHHHLLHYATEATPRLMWFNFAHLFSVSLLPLSTAWMAVSKLAPQPVAFYAAVFFLVNATYISLIWELIERGPVKEIPPKERSIMRFRSIATLCVFAAAAVVALKYPLVGLGMCCCCLIVYLKPEAPGAEP
jgi:uncharacterized membrane protein